MADRKTITIAIMDAPYESSRSTTALRLIDLAALEEQDDTIVWLHGAMKGAGADLAVLLRGNAVNYLVQRQDAGGLAFGEWRQTQPPAVASDLAALAAKGIDICYVAEDLAER